MTIQPRLDMSEPNIEPVQFNLTVDEPAIDIPFHSIFRELSLFYEIEKYQIKYPEIKSEDKKKRFSKLVLTFICEGTDYLAIQKQLSRTTFGARATFSISKVEIE